MKKIFIFLAIITLSSILFTGCFPYVYHNQDEVIIKNVNIDDTLKIAIIELNEGGFDSVLTIWAIRDQVITGNQAAEIEKIYLNNIEKLDEPFAIWHFAWAISNIYRNGNDDVKNNLEIAYLDAKSRPEKLEKFNEIANEHINGEKIYMGDVHDLGKAYAKTHIIVPGNNEYIQSFEEYLNNKEKQNKKRKNK